MQPRIEFLPEKKLVGKRILISFAHNKTQQLWQSFMPHRKELINSISTALYSVEIYPNTSFFDAFDPMAVFEKWAAVEVSDFESVPFGMETLVLPKGNYAVFILKGLASEGPKTYEYIFKVWFPQSQYELDDRPHFALMGDKYKNNDPESEEEI